MARRLAWALAAVLLPAVASAREVRLPLSVESPVLREALMRQLFNDPQQRAVFWGEPGSCSFFYLQDPKVDGEVDRLRVTAHGEARLGTEFGDSCLSPIAWSGFVEIFERPVLAGWELRFEVVDSNLYDEHHEKTLLVGQLWDRIKESVQPRFAAVHVDLGGPFRELRDFLPTVIGAGRAEELRPVLDSLRPVSARALPQGVIVEAALDVPEAETTPAPSATEPPLTDAEVDAFAARANQWDSFVTFVIKTLGRKTLNPASRQALLETLLDARYQILDALASPSRHEDPVRGLFLKSWERLRPVADDISRGLPGAESAQVLTFVAAGDALRALDQLGPTFGIEVSADGLRRMARMIAPTAADPLQYDPGLDTSLRGLLGFGEPISGESAAADTATPQPSSSPSPLEPSATASPTARWDLWWWLAPRESWAAENDHARDWRDWVVERAPDLTQYLRRVRQVISGVSSGMITKTKLSGADAELFRRLVAATAWQESCWRQFYVKNGVVTYLRSSRGSVGMLQLNERVWRGFYEVDKLRWKVAYNVEAGSEVLLRYMAMAADALPHGARPPTPAERARAAYAAYNGGPDQLRRYLDPKRRSKGLSQVIDQLFGAKIDAAGPAVETGVAACLTG